MESKTRYLDNNDEELVYMIQENSGDARDALFMKYSAMIHKELNRIRNSAYALGIEMSDLEQEAMLGFSGAINSYDSEADAQFSTYATLCVRRKLLNFLSKHATMKNFTMRNALSIDNDLDGNGKDYSYFLSENELKQPLNSIITQEELDDVFKRFETVLNKEEKRILGYAIEGMKAPEIAELTGYNVRKVYNILYRARKKIKS